MNVHATSTCSLQLPLPEVAIHLLPCKAARDCARAGVVANFAVAEQQRSREGDAGGEGVRACCAACMHCWPVYTQMHASMYASMPAGCSPCAAAPALSSCAPARPLVPAYINPAHHPAGGASPPPSTSATPFVEATLRGRLLTGACVILARGCMGC